MNSFYRKYGKRILDIIFSLAALIILSPLLLFIYILSYFKLGFPVLFKQVRPGKDGKLFTMYKFRSMTDEKDDDGQLLSDEERITKFGQFLRSTSLDELPELFNILKGDMSIVGPRPQLVEDMLFMDEEVQKRHEIVPGLTGLAQVSGRNAISWDDKFNYDLRYLQEVSLKTDLIIILKTIQQVFKRKDVNQEGHVASENYGDYCLRKNQISYEQYKKKKTDALRMLKNYEKNNVNS